MSTITPPRRRTLTVLSYNIHFGVGPSEVPVSRNRVITNLQGIGQLIRRHGVDLALLQEVDFDSARSHRIDQMRAIADEAGLPHVASVTNWRVRYLPYPFWPPQHHWGRIHSGLAVISRFELSNNRNYTLPKPSANSRLYNYLYLNRGAQMTDVLHPDGPIRLFNVHLEAYDKINRGKQARLLSSLIRARRSPRVILAGDFNAVPEDAPKKFGFADEPQNDMRGDMTLQIIGSALPKFQQANYADSPFTFPSSAPTRQLDYLFCKGLHPQTSRTLANARMLSDHLPLLVKLAVP